MALNTFVFLLLVNLLLLLAFEMKDAFTEKDPVTEKYGSQSVVDSYPHRTEAEVKDLLEETWSRRFQFEPYTMFVESPYAGTYVNVHEAGFRRVENQGPWPLDEKFHNVFVFGGSTVFGYGVADNETVPSLLQSRLEDQRTEPVRVYNFGRGHYTSTHERILFQQLLAAGDRPDEAIFIDGLNDFYYWGEPFYTRRLRRVLQDPRSRAVELLAEVPMKRAAVALRTLFGGPPDAAENDRHGFAYDDPQLLGGVLDRYRSNLTMINAVAAAYDIAVVHIWQPVPTFKNSHTVHPFLGWQGFEGHTFSRHGYPLMETLLTQGQMPDNFFSCADIQEGFEGPMYVDVVHYSAQFSTAVADCIVTRSRVRTDRIPLTPIPLSAIP